MKLFIEQNDVQISQMVGLALQYLFEIGRITAAPEVIIRALCQAIGLKLVNENSEAVFDQAMMFNWARGVFDRLIVVEASVSQSELLTKDAHILSNYSRAIW